MNRTTKNRNVAIDFMRFFCIFTVIVMHSSSYIYNTHTTSQIPWYISEAFIELGLFSVPVLFMISGYFLLDERKELTLKKLYFKNALRLITAFFCWSSVYALYSIRIWQGFVFTKESILNLIKLIINGPPHFWFIVVLLSIYVLLPVLREIAKNQKSMEYYIALFLVIRFIMPYFKLIPYLSKIAEQVERFEFGKIFGFVLYFILGYYLRVNPIKENNLKRVYSLGAISIVSNPIITAITSWIRQEKITYMENYQSIIVFVAAVSVFTFFTTVEVKKPTASKWIAVLSSTSFGVYLIHILVMNILIQLGVYSLALPTILLIPVVAVLTYSCSLLTILAIRQIPFISKYVM